MGAPTPATPPTAITKMAGPQVWRWHCRSGVSLLLHTPAHAGWSASPAMGPVHCRTLHAGCLVRAGRERVRRVAALQEGDVVRLCLWAHDSAPDEKVDQHQGAIGLEGTLAQLG